MNKFLQILLGVALTIWTVIGVGVIIGFFFVISLAPALGIKNSSVVNALTVGWRVQYRCVVDKVGTESARRVFFEGGEVTREFAEQTEPCFK